MVIVGQGAADVSITVLVVAASATFKEATGEVVPKDVAEMRDKILAELEMHLAEGKPAESFIERYKI